MVQIIVKDYETTDSRINFLQVLHAGLVITDNKLKIKFKTENQKIRIFFHNPLAVSDDLYSF